MTPDPHNRPTSHEKAQTGPKFHLPADWWRQQYAVPNELTKASFEKIMSFELDFGEPVPYGEHCIYLKSIELVGKYISEESWYLGILICWLIVIAAIGMVRLRQIYPVSLRQQHIQPCPPTHTELSRQFYKTSQSCLIGA